MSYRELFKEDNYEIRERYDLVLERIESILTEETVAKPYRDYFVKTAEFISYLGQLFLRIDRCELQDLSLHELEEINQKLYSDIIGNNYNTSYANPTYAVQSLGEDLGHLLSFLYTEIRGGIVYIYEHRLHEMTIHMELFIEIYNILEEEVSAKRVKQAIYWFVSDYCDTTVPYRIRELLDPSLNFAYDIIMTSDLSNIEYLYQYGEYIGENEIVTAKYLSSLSDQDIEDMASTYTEGFKEGFHLAGIDLTCKKYVNIRYNIGFERMVAAAIRQFQVMDLQPIMFRSAVNSINKKQHLKVGYISTSPNRQFDYDHRFDNGLYLDKPLMERKLTNMKLAYDQYKQLAKDYAGPACLEIFGESPFEPENKNECVTLDDKQQKLTVEMQTESASITNDYIKREEYSFTIIAYPVPEIGDKYEEIFKEIVKVNTLDKDLFKQIQQTIIDTLDQADYVSVKGKGDNKTDIVVNLHKINNPQKETNFENCLADVNIPVGEVFTSPKLTGTNGTLHVSEVYLNELKFIDLRIVFKDGMITEYSCKNFDNEEENKKFVKENLLGNRETLPIGEFAIGTNTTAYVMANKYDIVYKLPILIVEKMGPHFAVGDTCYSYSEDNRVYNPDGKEIIAKDNECSLKRRSDVKEAYFNIHTDITIPYDEIGDITAVLGDKTRATIIKDGRFVLKGCEALNDPFQK